MPYVIRQSKDYGKVKEINDLVFYEKMVDVDEDSVWWLVSEGGVAVGFGGVQEYNHNYAFLYRACILEDHRGYGLQRKLIKKRVKWAKDYGYKGVLTYTLAENTTSANNLIREGFLLFDPEEPWSSEEDGDPVLYWYLDF